MSLQLAPPDDGWLDAEPVDPRAPRPKHVGAAGDLGPTEADPLRGLDALARVAVLGREQFLRLASEPVDYLWQDLVVGGTIVVIAGAPGEGKTTLLFLLLAARLHYGGPVTLLDRLIVPAARGRYVVLVEGEHGESSAARKLIRSFELLGLDNAGLDRLILIARKAVRLGSPEWADVARLVAVGLVSDIALDTVARVAPANADNEAEQVAIFDLVAQTIEGAPEGRRPTAWALAHTRKNGTGGLADVSGSAQRTGQADSVLMLKAEKVDGRVAEVTVTFEKLREPPDEHPGPATFAIDAGGLRQGPMGRKDAEDARPLEERILEQLTSAPRTLNDLAMRLRRSKADVDAAITVLFGERRIQATQLKVRGQQRKAFELAGRLTGRVNL